MKEIRFGSIISATLLCAVAFCCHFAWANPIQDKVAPAKFYQEGLKAFKAKQYDLAKTYWLQAAGNGGMSQKKYKTVLTSLLSIRDYNTAGSVAKFNIKDYSNKEQGFAYNVLSNKLQDADTSKGLAVEPIELYNNYLSTPKKVSDKKKKIILSNYQYLLAYYTNRAKNYQKAAEVANKIAVLYPNSQELSLLPKKYESNVSPSIVELPKVASVDTAALAAQQKERALTALGKGNTAFEAKDYATAKRNWELAETLGNKKASMQLGNLYEKGLGVPKDYSRAKDQYEAAVGSDNPEAYGALGNLYENGLGVPKDAIQSKEWYKKGNEAGDPLSIEKLNKYGAKTPPLPSITTPKPIVNEVAATTANAISTTPNSGKIIGTIINATPANSNELCNKGFDEYKNGNYVQAKENWEKAAGAKGFSAAKYKSMNELGNLYFNGQGVEKDYAKSLEWYQKAAANGLPGGNPDAAKSVGTQYENGLGTTQNFVTALSWYKKAQKMGNKYVVADITRVAGNLKKTK